jgi:hypothetical protein
MNRIFFAALFEPQTVDSDCVTTDKFTSKAAVTIPNMVHGHFTSTVKTVTANNFLAAIVHDISFSVTLVTF